MEFFSEFLNIIKILVGGESKEVISEEKGQEDTEKVVLEMLRSQ